MKLIAVFTTVASTEQAQALARAALESGLAACVQSETIGSSYRWQGRLLIDEPELRLLFKTRATLYAPLERLLLELHPYELPAIFALPVTAATPDYAAWVAASTPAETPATAGKLSKAD
ncbi:divalent-cation tolerance protein CutA [Roseateles violae]|uniref:Divalent-cation tolerance protein CutA n=1 Tax=Roseateles violae TaxID=3058042 RepID=A0ABT8DMH3_9BURK|nr:divalent-cation tolerance protein CutA [Pelomonas sp. PFR6]MDN3919312.1 divalent-cation tolerance protein CutA [Pelomonas sp. PFR6]